jgi:hypothetical protein
MTSTTMLIPPSTRDVTDAGSGKRVWRAGAGAGAVASVAVSAFAAGARLFDVPLKLAGKSIPFLGFAQLTLMATIIATVLAVVLSHRASRPRRAFVTTTLALTLVSFVPDVLANAQASTKVALVLSHVVVAAIVIPALASRLTD